MKRIIFCVALFLLAIGIFFLGIGKLIVETKFSNLIFAEICTFVCIIVMQICYLQKRK